MKIIRTLLSAALLSSNCFAAISVTFAPAIQDMNDAFGQAKAGMDAVLIVDVNGDGFATGSYTSFDYLSTNGFFLPNSSGQTDDFLVYGLGGVSETLDTIFISSGLGGAGFSNIDTTGLVDGQRFGIMWFDSDSAGVGDSYGFISDNNWQIVTAPSSVIEIDGSGFTPGSAQYTVVPEPAGVALFFGLLAGAGMIWRRRK